ncbi:hypothetical protein EVAR_64554_1 [Eumeta japonica]|uniref:Uncharacterized protein n=1 Tax=Eumeta variegata TaxID=151549 RepID=A0A4C1SKC9_EUMVA|nr:hypothetical protein EVAR_64554_1 [Eumeta japonica]
MLSSRPALPIARQLRAVALAANSVKRGQWRCCMLLASEVILLRLQLQSARSAACKPLACACYRVSCDLNETSAAIGGTPRRINEHESVTHSPPCVKSHLIKSDVGLVASVPSTSRRRDGAFGRTDDANMWCTTTYFSTLCVVFMTCKVLPAPDRNSNMGVLRDADLLETSGTRGETQSEKVEDYEEVYDYIKMHETGGVLNTKVEFVNAPKGQEAKKVYDVKMKKKWPNRSNSIGNQTNQTGVFENDKAIVSLPEGQQITQELQKKKLKIVIFYKSKMMGK